MRASASDVRRALARGVADAVVDVVTKGWAVFEHGDGAPGDVGRCGCPSSSGVGYSALQEAFDSAASAAPHRGRHAVVGERGRARRPRPAGAPPTTPPTNWPC